MYLLLVFAPLICGLHATDIDGADINIVVATKRNEVAGDLFRINASSLTVEIIPAFKLVRPTAIALDDVTGRVYWSDVVTKEIRTSQLDGSGEKNFINFNTESIVDGITIDGVDRTLFYTDRGNHVIASVSVDNPRESHVLLTDVDNLPRAIVAHHKMRHVYWTDWGSSAHIKRCSYTGSGVETLVSKDIKWPNGLTLDTASDTLYWCDAFMGRIESVKIDGSERKVLTQSRTHYYGIAYFEGALYTTDWDSNSVKMIAMNGTTLASVSSEGFKKLSGLAVLRVQRAECKDGMYGMACLSECGRCLDEEICNKTDGVCPNGCEDGWITDRCDEIDFTMCNTGISIHRQDVTLAALQGAGLGLLLSVSVAMVSGEMSYWKVQP